MDFLILEIMENIEKITAPALTATIMLNEIFKLVEPSMEIEIYWKTNKSLEELEQLPDAELGEYLVGRFREGRVFPSKTDVSS